jgi:hypothetical protein
MQINQYPVASKSNQTGTDHLGFFVGGGKVIMGTPPVVKCFEGLA